MNRRSLKAYHAKKSNKKIVNDVTLSKEIHSIHSHPKGGLSLYSVHDKKKVQIENPIFIKHGKTVFAKGNHNGHMVSQIVKHTD